MTDPRDVIGAALDSWLHDETRAPTRAEHILAALAAAGIGTYDTAAHAAVPREEAEWQPMETVPKDGTSFLACSHASSVFLARWANGVVDGSSYSDDTGYLERYATRWRALPEPAAAEAEAKEPTTSAIDKAKKDARIYGTGFYRVLPDGSFEHLDPTSVFVLVGAKGGK